MTKFNFTKDEVEYFIDKCMLNEELTEILKMLNMDYSRVQISMKLNISTRTLDRRIQLLKKKIKKVI